MRAFRIKPYVGVGIVGPAHHELECLLRIEIARAKGINAGQNRIGRITHHHAASSFATGQMGNPPPCSASFTSDCAMSLACFGNSIAIN